MAALAAHLLRQPVRVALTRAEDMAIMGGRHPVRSRYDVGFSREGRVRALRVQSWLEAGFSLGFSSWIPIAFAKAILQYDWENLEVQIATCK